MSIPPPAGANIWPPPPTNAPDDGRSQMVALLSKYRSPTALSRWTIGFLALAVIMDIATTIGVLGGASTHAFADTAASASSFTTLITGILFLTWIYRLYKNLSSLGATGLRQSPGLAVAMFILPFLSLYRPFVVTREIWRASSSQAVLDQVSGRWTLTPSTPLIGFWWVTYIAYNLIEALAAINAKNSQPNTTPYIVSTIFAIISGALAVLIVARLTARQELRHGEVVQYLAG